jgi:PAS domain S-box-containing protein
MSMIALSWGRQSTLAFGYFADRPVPHDMNIPALLSRTLAVVARSSAWREVFLLVLLGIAVYGLAAHWDVAGRLDHWMHAHERLELAQFMLVLNLLFVGVAGFACQRWWESHGEVRKRQAAVRELAEEVAERQKGEERLRLATEATGLGTYDIDLTTGERQWSPEMRTILGLAPDAPIDQEAYSRLIHPDDRDHANAEFSRRMSHVGTPMHAEYRIVSADTGEVRWVSEFSRALADEHGRPVRLVGTLRDITGQKEAERLAAEKSALLEATLDNMDQGLIVLDADHRIVLHNQRTSDLLGLPADLLASRPLFEDVRRFQAQAGDFAYVPDEMMNIVMQEGFNAGPRVYERTRPDGTVLEVRTTPMRNGGAVRTYTNITARRKAEAEVRETAERLALANKATSDAIWDWNLVSDEIQWTEAVRPLFGYTPEDVQDASQWWKDRVHPEDQGHILASLQVAIDGGATHWWEEYRFQRADGTYAPVLDRGYLMRDEAGQPVRMVGAMQDLTERKKAEETLRLRDRALSSITQGVVITDPGQPDNPIIYANPAFERITGYTAEEVLGRNCRFLQGPETEREAVERLRTALRTKKGTTETLINYRRDGTKFRNELVISPVMDEKGNVTHFVGIQSDVTRRLEVQEQLQQAQKMETVGQLTGGIAHDFNNLLTVVIGNTELLSDEAENPRVKELADMALAAAERGAELNQKLLAFGRRQSLRPKPVRLDEVVVGMAPLLRRTLGEHIDLRTAGSTLQATALVDRALLESAVLNLAVNARDAMPDGGTLMLEVEEVENSSGVVEFVSLTVKDTGTGMAPEVLERVFEPFFTTKEVGKGSGLGLAMVHGFVEQSGGHVTIKSKVGSGTSVTILLPAAAEVASTDERTASRTAAPEGRAKVLVVEDEPDVRRYATTTLSALGYQVIEAADGVAALDALKQDAEIKLLFSDVVLPKGISGLELARRAQATRPALKVLLTSGYSEEACRRFGQTSEETSLLPKPYKRAELAGAIQRALGSEARADAA